MSPPPSAARVEADDRFDVPWHPLDGALAFLLTLVFAFGAGGLLAGLGEGGVIAPQVARGLQMSVSGVMMAVATLYVVRLRTPGNLWRLRGPRRAGLRDAVAGIVHGLLAYVGINILLGSGVQLVIRTAGGEVPTVQPYFQEAARDPAVLPFLVLSALIVAPFAEELLFRGLLFQALRSRVGAAVGAVLSGALFALVHVSAAAAVVANVVVLAMIFPLGAWLAVLFHRRGTLLVPLLAHVAYNLVGVVTLAVRAG